jgi:hypothetical protein
MRGWSAYLGFRSFHDDMHTYHPAAVLRCKIAMPTSGEILRGPGLATIATATATLSFLPEQLRSSGRIATIARSMGCDHLALYQCSTRPLRDGTFRLRLEPQRSWARKWGRLCMLGLLYKIRTEWNDSNPGTNSSPACARP